MSPLGREACRAIEGCVVAGGREGDEFTRPATSAGLSLRPVREPLWSNWGGFDARSPILRRDR
jgi:hypothetical protein